MSIYWFTNVRIYYTNIHLSLVLMERYCLTEHQLNCEIGQDDITLLAKHFEKIELYFDLMNLSSAEKDDVEKIMHSRGSQVAMIKCLSLWKGHDSFKATFLALLEILIKLEKGEIARNVCQYLAEKNGRLYRVYECMKFKCAV